MELHFGRDGGWDRAPFSLNHRRPSSWIYSKAKTKTDARTKEIIWIHNQNHKNQMNPQPKPQKNETHEARMKENETHRCALVKEAFLGMKGYVGRVLCLFVRSPIHLQWLHDAIEPELVTRSACNKWSKRKMVFEEKVKYWCDCGCCDSWPVVKLLILI